MLRFASIAANKPYQTSCGMKPVGGFGHLPPYKKTITKLLKK
jgi:hypothetical protein